MIDRADPTARRAQVLGRLDDTVAADPEGRARDRHRRIAVATIAGTASRGLTALALVVALPLASRHLTADELGVWSLLVTAVALLGFADLGLGNGLVNVLSDAIGTDDRTTARRAVTAASAGLLGLAIVGAGAAIASLVLVPWDAVLGIDPGDVPDLTAAIAVFAAMVLVSIPAGVGQRIHLAYQQGWAASLTSGAGSALSLVAVSAAAAADASLPWFVAAMLGGQAVAAVAETAWVFGRSHRDLVPRRDRMDAGSLRRLLRSGLLFFVLAAAGAAAYQSDTLVIAHHLGVAEVTQYAVSLRLFMLAPTAVAAMLLPLWPAYGEALARQDHPWVRATLGRSVLISVAVTAASSIVLLFLARPLVHAWAPATAEPSQTLLVGLAVWAVVSSLSTALAMYFNGANIIRFQVIVAITMAVANLALSIVLVRRWGVAGPVWASVITQTVVVVIPELFVVVPIVRHRVPDVDLAPDPSLAAQDLP